MARIGPDIVICCLILGSVAVIYVLTQLLRFVFDDSLAAVPGTKPVFPNEIQDNWIFRLTLNLLGYATVFFPGYLIYQYVKKCNYIERSGSGALANLIRQCFASSDSTERGQEHSGPVSRSMYHDALLLSFCVIGLQVSYLTWGIIQEKIMTKIWDTAGQERFRSLRTPFYRGSDMCLLVCCVDDRKSFENLALWKREFLHYADVNEAEFPFVVLANKEYVDSNGVKGYFKDSQFLVFVNRILAFALSSCYIIFRPQGRHTAPLYKYAYCSFSNILSSWCQYEALKYVSFPTQVLAKASKIIPVMFMGKIVSRTKYEYYEYVTALLISAGMGLFLWGGGPSDSKGDKTDHASSLSGFILLATYLIADSFTSNWQGALFQQHHVSSVQMMCGVNLFSCFFTAVSLLQQGGFGPSIAFMSQFYQFTFDCVLLSVCSASGQMFIFFTISNYGPVVFAIIMTIRQGLAILLSYIIYHHDITVFGVLGVIIVFLAVFLRIYCSQRLKAIHRRRMTANLPSKV